MSTHAHGASTARIEIKDLPEELLRGPAAGEDEVVDGGLLGRAVLVAAGNGGIDRARYLHHC